MTTPANRPDCREALRDLMSDALLRGDPEAMHELILRVLRRLHEAADALDDPSDARVIFDVAHAFAEELAAANPQFDRIGFIKAATNGVAP